MTNWSQTQAQKTIDQFSNPFKFWLFKWTMLPPAGFMGLKMKSLDANQCQVGIKYGWRSKNPFKSIYFAAQCAAGELATGAVAMVVANGFDEKILMVVTHVEAEFTTKAVGNITCTCNEGKLMIGTIQDGILNNQAKLYRATAVGIDEKGDIVSKIYITWSFKAKTK